MYRSGIGIIIRVIVQKSAVSGPNSAYGRLIDHCAALPVVHMDSEFKPSCMDTSRWGEISKDGAARSTDRYDKIKCPYTGKDLIPIGIIYLNPDLMPSG